MIHRLWIQRIHQHRSSILEESAFRLSAVQPCRSPCLFRLSVRVCRSRCWICDPPVRASGVEFSGGRCCRACPPPATSKTPSPTPQLWRAGEGGSPLFTSGSPGRFEGQELRMIRGLWRLKSGTVRALLAGEFPLIGWGKLGAELSSETFNRTS